MAMSGKDKDFDFGIQGLKQVWNFVKTYVLGLAI